MINQQKEPDHHLDSIPLLLSIKSKDEMKYRLDRNIPIILEILTYASSELPSMNDMVKLRECLKFIDTLNLFMPIYIIRKIEGLMTEIHDTIISSKGLSMSLQSLLDQIDYTKKSFVFVRKAVLNDLCFADGNGLGNEIMDLITLISNGKDDKDQEKIDHDLFRQVSNIYYIVSNRLNDDERSMIERELNKYKQILHDPSIEYEYDHSHEKYSCKEKGGHNYKQVKFTKKIRRKNRNKKDSSYKIIHSSEKHQSSYYYPIEKNEAGNEVNTITNNTSQNNNRFQESLKSVDPQILLKIKQKLQQDSIINKTTLTTINGLQFDFSFNYCQIIINNHHNKQERISYNSQQLQPETEYNNPFFNFISLSSHNQLHREYMSLKANENENPALIKSNIAEFEQKILLPYYHKITEWSKSSHKLYRKVKNVYKKKLTKMLSAKKVDDFTIKPYGSFINSFLLEEGDIDICILINKPIEDFALIFKQIEDEFRNYNNCTVKHSILNNKTYLLISLIDKPTNISIDLSVHTLNPEFNSNVIRFYAFYDQRFHILGLYLKTWAKNNEIHKASDGFLSSYALLILLISFLQKIEPRVLPYYDEVETKIINMPYDPNEDDYNEEDDDDNVGDNNKDIDYSKFQKDFAHDNKDSVGQLLIYFLEYYAYIFNHDYCISIRNKEKTFNLSNIAFSIIDPFDTINNPGKSMKINSKEFDIFTTAIKTEINYIFNGEYLTRLKEIQSKPLKPYNSLSTNTSTSFDSY